MDLGGELANHHIHLLVDADVFHGWTADDVRGSGFVNQD